MYIEYFEDEPVALPSGWRAVSAGERHALEVNAARHLCAVIGDGVPVTALLVSDSDGCFVVATGGPGPLLVKVRPGQSASRVSCSCEPLSRPLHASLNQGAEG